MYVNFVIILVFCILLHLPLLQNQSPNFKLGKKKLDAEKHRSTIQDEGEYLRGRGKFNS